MSTSLIRNFTHLLGSRVCFLASLFVADGLVNRSLGPADRGVLAEMHTWVTMFVALAGLSLDTAIYHFANPDAYADPEETKLGTSVGMSAACSCAAAIGLLLLTNLASSSTSDQAARSIVFLMLWAFLFMVSRHLRVFLEAHKHVAVSAAIGVARAAVYLAVIVPAFVFGRLTVFWVVASMIAMEGSATAIGLVVLARRIRHRWRFSSRLARGMVWAGLRQHVATVSTFVYVRLNQLLVCKYCSEEEAGVFAVAQTLAFAFMFVPATLQSALYPRVIHAEDEYEVTVQTMSLTFYAWGGVILGLLVLARPLVMLYAGAQFVRSVSVFRLLLPAAWFVPLAALLAPYYVKAGAFSLASLSAVVLAGTSVCLSLYLIPRHLAMGAALATCCTGLVGLGLTLAFLWFLSRRNPFVIFLPVFGWRQVLALARRVWRDRRTWGSPTARR